MQSVGFNNKYSKALHKLGYAIVIPVDSFSLHYFIISIINIHNGIRLKIPNGPISDKWTNYKITLILLILLTNETLMLSLLGLG
jgi:hypothetical protein